MNSILSVYVDLLELPLDQYISLVQLFNYVPLLVSLPAAHFLDRFGLRITVLAAALLAGVRNTIRALLFAPQPAPWHQIKLLCFVVQCCFMNAVVSIYYILPLVVSESWFPESERSLAWTLICVMPLLGTAGSALVVPHYVTDAKTVGPLAYVNLISTGLTLAAVTLCVTKSAPRWAPSERNRRQLKVGTDSMWLKLARLVTDWNVMLQLLALASFEAIINSINFVMQDILSGSGLSKVFCGQFLASMSIVAVVIQVVGSLLMEPTKSVERSNQRHADEQDDAKTRTCKLYMALRLAAFLAYAAALIAPRLAAALGPHQWWLALASSTLYTALKCYAAPHYNEKMAQLIAGRVSEASLSAFTTVATCCLMNLFSLLFVRLRRLELAAAASRPDYSQSIAFASGSMALVTLAYLLLFSGRPKPLAERNHAGSDPLPATGVTR